MHPNQPFALLATGKTETVLVNPSRITAAAEYSTGLETIVSGSYAQTQASDDAYEVLQEVLQGGVSVLEHVWRFDNVPLGSCLTLNLEGNRPSNPDGDGFNFYWSEPLDDPYTPIQNVEINLPAELQGGINYLFPRASLDRVNTDRLEIR